MQRALASRILPARARPTPLVARSLVGRTRLCVYSKQHVPSDSFGGLSPEKKAANALRTLFTFVAVKIILAQLEGSGRGALGSYNKPQYDELYSFLQSEPLRDGDEWIAKLMQRNSLLALRVLEVRVAYGEEDFEFEQLQRLARRDMQEANVQLMRKFASSSLEAAATAAEGVEAAAAGGDGGAPGDAPAQHGAAGPIEGPAT